MRYIRLPASQKAYLWAPRVLTGPRLAPMSNVLLEIEDGVIARIDRRPRSTLTPETTGRPDYHIVPDGATLLPCLMDAHVHLGLSGNPAGRRSSDGSPVREGRHRLEKLAEHGVGVVRDGGDREEIGLAVANAQRKENSAPTRIVGTGHALRRSGDYGSFLGAEADSYPDLLAAVERLASSGAEQIKVLLSGIVSFEERRTIVGTGLPMEDVRGIAARAHELGLRVMAHANGAAVVDAAVRAGVDSIEHGYFLREHTLREMARRGTEWVPTMIPVQQSAQRPSAGAHTENEIRVITEICREHRNMVNLGAETGVLLGVGTDAGAPGVTHGKSLIEEMLLYRQSGLTNQQIIQAATWNNACILGLEHALGTIEIGKEPPFLAVDGNPSSDLRALQRPLVLFCR
ncbi:MAG: amidohydrolase family protein [Rhodothermales bacterium]